MPGLKVSFKILYKNNYLSSSLNAMNIKTLNNYFYSFYDFTF